MTAVRFVITRDSDALHWGSGDHSVEVLDDTDALAQRVAQEDRTAERIRDAAVLVVAAAVIAAGASLAGWRSFWDEFFLILAVVCTTGLVNWVLDRRKSKTRRATN